MALWWTSSLSLTLNTVSVLVTQYNNTAVTRTTTLYEDVKSVNITTMKEAQSMAFDVLTAIDPEYLANGFILNNGTNAFVDGTFSVAYPTPYIGIQGFEFISVTQQASQCPKGLQYAGQNLGTAECACLMQTYMDDPRRLGNAITSQITLSSTYYELGNPHPVNNDLGTILEGPIPIKNASYFNFIESVLGSEGFNKYRSCEFLDVGVGPPALMMPVTALTATTTATVKSPGNHGTPSLKPGSPIAPIIHPPTSTPAAPPSAPIVEPKPVKEPLPASSTAPYVAPQTVAPVAEPAVPIVDKPTSSKVLANNPVNEPAKGGSQGAVQSPSDSSGTSQTDSSGGQHAVGPSDSGSNGQSNTGAQSDSGSHSDNSNGKGSYTGDNQAVPAPVVDISYAGSSITPDTSSHYNIPEIGKLSPGGSPVTTNNVVFSLAPSATALVSNGRTISVPTFAAAVPGSIKQTAAPALTFAGSTYTADSSSHIVVAGQTIIPGGPAVTISNTPVSLAYGASVAIVGGTTQSLYPSVPTAHPETTIAGETYTADSDSAIMIQGQTLIPGSPAITISNTPISLAPGASIAVIAGQTQSLSPAAATARPAFTFAGSTYTANVASTFTIQGQTLSPGGVITVSNTPISLATDASFAVVAGSMQSIAPLAPAPTTEPPTFTFNGSTYTAIAGSTFVIAGQTLTEGGVVTVAGTPILYASGGGDVVVGTSTEAVGIGGLIMSGFGGGGASTATGPVLFTGGAMRCGGSLSWYLMWAMMGGIILVRLR